MKRACWTMYGDWLLATLLLVSLSREARAQSDAVPPPVPTPAVPTPPMQAAPAEPVPDVLRSSPGGLTSDAVGRRAMATSFAVKQFDETMQAAAARVDQSWQAFLPKLRTSGSVYLVDITNPPSLGTVVVDNGAPGPIGAAQVAGGKLKAIPLALPTTLGSYLLEASITVPISDYFLKLGQSHAAANESRDAARYDLAAAKASSFANGKVAFYTWLRARGAVVVAEEALKDQKSHLDLVKNQLAVGRASQADALRAETDVASAELSLEDATNLADLGEKQLRVAIHAKDDESLAPGESLEGSLPPVQGVLRALEDEGIERRAEVKSLVSNAASLREQAKATRNAGYPSLSASANAMAVNSDSGSLGPTSNWIGIWYVSAQLSWSPNETGIQASAGADASHRAAALEAQASQLKDSIEVEVKQSYQAARQADVAITTADRELRSAEEGYRVAKALFDNGRSLSSQLTDAETDLTRARLDLLNARANARIARVQLEHALGRDL